MKHLRSFAFCILPFISVIVFGKVIATPLEDLTESKSKCLDLEPSETQIGLRISKEGRFENRITTGNKSVYDIPSGVQVEVKCLSRSPVTIKFHGLLAYPLIDSSTSRFSLEDGWMESPSNFCFEARVLFHSSTDSTGRYECVDIGVNASNESENAQPSQNNSSSIYIFANGNRYPHLLHAGKRVIPVTAFPGDGTKLVLPCITNNASVPIRLFKNGQQLQPSDEISYDPREGFTISNPSCGETYICTDKENVSDNARNVRISVSCPKENLENPRKPEFKRAVFKQSNGDEAIEYRCLESTSMSVAHCKNLLECEFLQSCGTSVPQRICRDVTDVCEGGNITSSNCLSVSTSAADKYRGLIFCSNENATIQMEIFSDVLGNKSFDINFGRGVSRPTRSYKKWLIFIPTLYKTWNNVRDFNLYESVRFECNVSKVLGADGIELLFQFGNGSRIPALTSDEINSQDFNVYSKSADVYFNYSEITKLICRAPYLNSKEWHEISKDVVMHEYAPIRLHTANETKHVSKENTIDDEHRLSCIVSGTHTAVSWMKNGWIIAGSHDVEDVKLNETHRRSTLLIYHEKSGNWAGQNASHANDVYSCTVKNGLNETQAAYFTVEWYKHQPIALVSSIVVAILIICLAIMGIAYKYLKSHLKNQALKKIRKEFIEGEKLIGIDAMSNKSSCDLNEYQSAKSQKILPGDPNYYRTQPYIAAYEIGSPDKNLKLGRQLGEGEFGVVYQAELKDKNGDWVNVAIKTLKDDPDEKFWKDFLNEIKLLQQITNPHKNVVKFIGAVTADMVKTKKPKIIFEYCPNGNLHSFLKDLRDCDFLDQITTSSGYTAIEMISIPPQGGLTYMAAQPRITTTHLFRWCHEIADGMEYLSSLGIIHRDIAARNILLTQNLEAKISDLGLSKSVFKNETSSHYYNTSCYIPAVASKDLVAVRWVPIESLEENVYSENSDIWAFGVLMWEIFNLCRCQPYSHIENNNFIVHTLKEFLNQGNRLVKPKFANDKIYNVMLECWAQEKESRPRFSELTKLTREAEAAMSANNNSSYQNNTNYSENYSESGSESDEIVESDEEQRHQEENGDPEVNYCQTAIIPMTEELEV